MAKKKLEEGEVVQQLQEHKFNVRIKISAKLKPYGEYSFKGIDKADLVKSGEEAVSVFKEHLKKWEKK